MTQFARLALAAVAVLTLAACGRSDSAKEQAQPDNVEMPAEEAVGDLPAAATPVPGSLAESGATGAPASAAPASDQPGPQ